jgi:hypothetical protein
MAEHAKAQGFGGIVLMIDEFLLWLAEKSGQEFVAEINNLNVIVDHRGSPASLGDGPGVARRLRVEARWSSLRRFSAPCLPDTQSPDWPVSSGILGTMPLLSRSLSPSRCPPFDGARGSFQRPALHVAFIGRV